MATLQFTSSGSENTQGAVNPKIIHITGTDEHLDDLLRKAREIAWRCQEAIGCLSESASPSQKRQWENGLMLEWVSGEFILVQDAVPLNGRRRQRHNGDVE